jgi:hypothetical protein
VVFLFVNCRHKKINMNIREIFVTGFTIIALSAVANGQVIDRPNYALKSHETLEIKKIVTNAKSSTFLMSIENRIQGGEFCADKNIYIVYPDGTRNKILSSNGIPVCPDSYKFKSPGEKLDFVLVFPPIKPGIDWIDLVEDCNDNCFSFYGLITNEALNNRIDEAFALAEKNEPAGAMVSFIKIAEETEKMNSAISPLLYINITKLARETGNNLKSAEWYNRLKNAGFSGKERYIKFLNGQGILY